MLLRLRLVFLYIYNVLFFFLSLGFDDWATTPHVSTLNKVIPYLIPWIPYCLCKTQFFVRLSSITPHVPWITLRDPVFLRPKSKKKRALRVPVLSSHSTVRDVFLIKILMCVDYKNAIDVRRPHVIIIKCSERINISDIYIYIYIYTLDCRNVDT